MLGAAVMTYLLYGSYSAWETGAALTFLLFAFPFGVLGPMHFADVLPACLGQLKCRSLSVQEGGPCKRRDKAATPENVKAVEPKLCEDPLTGLRARGPS